MFRKLTSLFNLRDGEENRELVRENIIRNISFRGPNIWILACAILVASVGLNVNSAAVVIGAMLISPLMGPIVGAGFALGVYDFQLLKQSMRNLLVATLVSLSVSTLYFVVSPFKDVQSELLSRTAPNIYDVIIAFFGGLVGVIAVTRAEKGNPIPGVAIATALMPPLCTAGYGLATNNWGYFLGAFYLYSINCTFIGIATYIIIKYLKYPAKKQVDEKNQRLVRNGISVLVAVMLIPSAYLAWSLYAQQQLRKQTDAFMDKEFVSKGYTIVYKKTNFTSTPKKVELAFLSHRFSKPEIDTLNKRLSKELDENVALVIRQDSTDRLAALRGDLLNEIKITKNSIEAQQLRQSELLTRQPQDERILQEARTLFPTVSAISAGERTFTFSKDSTAKEFVVIIDSNPDLPNTDKERLQQWLKQRFNVEKLTLYNRETP